MPLNIDIVQILLHMLNFVILAGGLTLILYKPVCKFLDERHAHFENLEKENAEKAAENERLKEEYEKKIADSEIEISELRHAAEKEAAEKTKAYIEAAREQADGIIAAAEEDAERRKVQILESTQTEMEELVIEATQKILTGSASEEHTRNLYDEFIRNADKLQPEKRA